MRKFNTAGPSIPGDHYMLDPCMRIDVEEIERLIDDKRYFVLHAPRQTGKTTSLLWQIRAGYVRRPQAFPQTVILCGVRDVRDNMFAVANKLFLQHPFRWTPEGRHYRIHTAHHEIITGGSVFNIKAESIRMGNLSRAETEELWRQHEAESGQPIDPAIYPELWADTEGQPWLVNALGYEVTWGKDRSLRDRTKPITLEHYKAARERLIQSRATHLDQLTDKLREERVRNVIAPLLESPTETGDLREEDLQYVEDLGLIRRKPSLAISNRIYREVLPREITSPMQDGMYQSQAWYLTAERRLDMDKLLTAFQQFFREHSDAWLDGFDYREAGPQLLMQAFLQRIVNGGGRIGREYGLGMKRTDLFLEWPLEETEGVPNYNGPVQRVVIELQLLKKAPETTLKEGLAQTAEYADRCGADEAHLVIFDRRPKQSWTKRIWKKTLRQGERGVAVWGC